MTEPKTSESVKHWLQDLDQKLDQVKETTIRTESKLEAYSTRTGETEATLKAHDLRLGTLESELARMQGAQRMLQWLGGVVGGLVLIGQLAVMILKG